MDTLPTDITNVVVKQEPLDQPTSPDAEENNNNNNSSNNDNNSIARSGARSHSSSSLNIKLKSSGDKTSKDNKTPGDVDTHAPSTHNGQLRYISRRGRPPGGGYSMKSAHSHYVSFGQSPVGMGSHDLLRQSTLGTSATSPHDLLKNGLDSNLDSLDARRFGLHCFEGEKNSFRCDGCDVVFGSRDTYAMHMLLRAKNESCVALPTSAISANPENPTPREKFERELREKAMITAIRSQAALMSKAAVAAAVMPRSSSVSVVDSALQSLSARSPTSSKEELSSFSGSDLTAGLNSLFAFDSYGLYMDQRQYRRLLSEYSFKAASASPSALSAMMEQLSCTVCGEVFTNKDALAMHMMFHTRDDEGDTKPVVPSWKMDTSPSSIGKMMPLSVNTDNSSGTHLRKQEGYNRNEGDRQLTVERIEELKRMAIESSLKSSLRKFPKSTERNSRPKSVSEDTIVTSSAQTRPLSADDAFKVAHPGDNKGIYKPHKMVFKASIQKENESDDGDNENNSNYNHRSERSRDAKSTSTIPFRKRTLSISEDYLNTLSPFYKRQKHFYSDNDVRSIAFRYDTMKSSISKGADISYSKVCDNHVSSASGPQDSDETSNGSSSTVLEATRIEFGNNKTNRDIESSSSLENIMSGESILVPVDNPEELQVNGDDVCQLAGDRAVAAAIDFSVGKTGITAEGKDHDDDDDDDDDNDDTSSSRRHFFSDSSRMFGASPPSARPPNNNNNNHNNNHNNSNSGRPGGGGPLSQDNDNGMSDAALHQHRVELLGPDDDTTTTQQQVAAADHLKKKLNKDNSSNSIGIGGARPRSYDDDDDDDDDEVGVGVGGGSGGAGESSSSSRVGGEARYCPHCEILFLDVTLFHLHMGLHNVNNPWQCNICGLACAGRLEFNTHVLHY